MKKSIQLSEKQSSLLSPEMVQLFQILHKTKIPYFFLKKKILKFNLKFLPGLGINCAALNGVKLYSVPL